MKKIEPIQTVTRCIDCGQPITKFRDIASEKEYKLRGFCRNCQEHFFGGGEVREAVEWSNQTQETEGER